MFLDLIASLTSSWPPILILTIIPLIILLRYFLIAGTFFGASVIVKKKSPWRKLQSQPFTAAQIRREIGYSALTATVFTGVVALIYLMSKAGWTQIYREQAEYGAIWFWLQIPLVLIIQDFYFYWMHRAIHLPGVYELVHEVHHLSINPSSFSAFAFHPVEAFLEIGFAIVLVLIMPLSIYALGVVGLFSLLYNSYGHMGYEVMPRWLAKAPMGEFLNKSAYHNQHHRAYHCNYGLYTTIWDRLFGTLHADAEALYDQATIPPDGIVIGK